MTVDLAQKKILIVDDARENIDVLRGVLVNYALVAALAGRQALAIAGSAKPPDLILLDIMMPDMDGYEVCRLLKADAKTADIPIIFLTAKATVEDEAKGLALGAVDYITKPISPPVVLARVATHLAMRDAYRQLERQYAALREMEQLRKDVEAITRHDLKSPIDGIIGCSNLLLQNESLPRADLKTFHQMIRDAAHQLREMVNLSLNLIKMEQGGYLVHLQPLDLMPVIHRLLTDNQTLMARQKIETILLVNGHPAQQAERFIVLGDETLCYTMLANLYRNALEASKSGQAVTIALNQGAMATLTMHNPTVVPEEIRAHFFDKYVTSGKKGGTGLGTYSARLMAETQQGSIHLQSSEAEGTTLTLTLRQATEEG